ncbi:hypothetical protein [Flavisphingomonas formosensis]|uniref:hypothetical protein n=1 Tax=Flavisphingomonas formosensis TaxID=861534 RepID=UPI0012F87F67|nr:hypothetical protein [Sphingomonas formosensis]
MEPVSSADHLIAVLRRRLLERTQAKGGGRPEAGKQQEKAPSGLDTLAALQGAEPSQLRRACVQALLTEQFGAALINDAQFQQIVSRVSDTIAADPQASSLIDQVIAQLRPR